MSQHRTRAEVELEMKRVHTQEQLLARLKEETRRVRLQHKQYRRVIGALTLLCLVVMFALSWAKHTLP